MGAVKDLLVKLDDENVLLEVQKQLDAGVLPEEILLECQAGMVEIGNEFSNERMFVSDLMMSGFIFKSISELLLPLIKGDANMPSKGKVILGTVKDDIHDIGKDIVANMLQAGGFEVIDLGVDVPPQNFVDAVKEHGAKVVAMSCLLVSCYDSIKETIAALEKEGLRDSVKIIIGGGPIDQHVVEYSGADAYGAGAQDAVNYCGEVLCS